MTSERLERIEGPNEGETGRSSWPWGATIALLCGLGAWLGVLIIFFGASLLPMAFYRGSSHGEGYNTGTWSILLLAISRELWFASMMGGCLALSRAMQTNDRWRRYAMAWPAVALGLFPWMRVGPGFFFGRVGLLSSLVGLAFLYYVARPSARQLLSAFLGGVAVAGAVAAAIGLLGPDVTGIEWETYDEWQLLVVGWLANLALVATAMTLLAWQVTMHFGWRGLAMLVVLCAIIKGVPAEQMYHLPGQIRHSSVWNLRASAGAAGAIVFGWLVMWLAAKPARMDQPSRFARNRLLMTVIVFVLCYSDWLGVRAFWTKLQMAGGALVPVGALLLFVVVWVAARASVRRGIGALAGGAAVAAVLGLLLATRDTESNSQYLYVMLIQMWEPPWIDTGLLRDYTPAIARPFQTVMVTAAVLWAPIALISWRAVRFFGGLGLVVTAAVAAVAGPPWESLVTLHNYSYSADFIVLPLTIVIEYATAVLLAYSVMRVIAGSAAER